MQTLTPDQLIHSLNWRYATKAFDPARKLPASAWHALEQSLVLSPSSFGLQPWTFVVIADSATKQKLPAISWNQSQVRDASHVVVIAAKKHVTVADVDRHIGRIGQVRGQTAGDLSGYREMMAGFVQNPPPGFDAFVWASRQAYIAMGMFMASAAVMGIDTCPMEGIDSRGYDSLLGLEAKGFATLAVIAAGYRSADDKYAGAKKVRFAVEEVVQRIG